MIRFFLQQKLKARLYPIDQLVQGYDQDKFQKVRQTEIPLSLQETCPMGQSSQENYGQVTKQVSPDCPKSEISETFCCPRKYMQCTANFYQHHKLKTTFFSPDYHDLHTSDQRYCLRQTLGRCLSSVNPHRSVNFSRMPAIHCLFSLVFKKSLNLRNNPFSRLGRDIFVTGSSKTPADFGRYL